MMKSCVMAIGLASCVSIGAAAAPLSGSERAAIYRDEWGVPHIYARDEAAGFYALGYAQGEDRPTRTMFLFRFARGDVANALGPNYLDADIRNRLWRHREMGERGIARLDPALRRDLEAYVQGLKAALEKHGALPKDFDLSLNDVMALERAPFFFGYQASYAQAKCSAKGLKFAAAEDRSGTASNGWGVMPSRTADGAVILASDPHVSNNSAFYYEFHMEAGPLHSAGYAMGPFLWQIHNRHLAWAMTTGGPDVVDCYEVEVDPANPRRYLFDGKWQDMILRHEHFEIAGAPAVDKDFEYTMHNGVMSPVIERRDGKAYVASAPAMDHAGRFAAEILAMNRATDVASLKQAMRGLGMFYQNLTVGDDKGNLYYLRAGATAIRSPDFDWTMAVPGNDSRTTWRGLHKLEDLVQVLNPKTGYVENNNVAPDAMMAEGNDPISARDYPKDVFNDQPGRRTSRGIRAAQVLSANAHMTVEDALNLAMDETWISAADWREALSDAAAKHPEFLRAHAEPFGTVLAALLAFDGKAAADSQAATAFYLWRTHTVDLLERPEFAEYRNWPWTRNSLKPEFGLALLESLDATVGELKALPRGIETRLGDLFVVGRGDPGLAVGGVTIRGRVYRGCPTPIYCEQTMRAFGAADPKDGKPQHVESGSQAMRLAIFTKPMQAYSLYAFGESDDPASPHYDDQAKLFHEKRMKRAYFDWADVAAHAESKEILEPSR